MDNLNDIVTILASTVRLGTPLILCAIAGLFSERSGVVDMGLEGKMLGGAFLAASVAYMTGSPWLGLLAAIGFSIAISMLHGYACVTLNGDQVVTGVAINIMIAGFGPTFAFSWFNLGGRTPNLSGGQRFKDITLPLADSLKDVPVIGTIYEGLLSGHNILVYAAFAIVPLAWWVLYKTRFGLRLRAVGENPSAVDVAGISVRGMRYQALAINGVLCGIAGAYLSTAHGAGFIRDMSAGKGYLALAALIFGKWKPGPTLAACLLFAFADAVQVRIQGVPLPIIGEVPSSFVQMIPYVLTVLVLAGFVGKSVGPKASGIPYVKER
jgi:simple sugar transport system permease protein